ncbi:hypothetical protein PTKU46_12030 [Paraburkholderia terrae]
MAAATGAATTTIVITAATIMAMVMVTGITAITTAGIDPALRRIAQQKTAPRGGFFLVARATTRAFE